MAAGALEGPGCPANPKHVAVLHGPKTAQAISEACEGGDVYGSFLQEQIRDAFGGSFVSGAQRVDANNVASPELPRSRAFCTDLLKRNTNMSYSVSCDSAWLPRTARHLEQLELATALVESHAVL